MPLDHGIQIFTPQPYGTTEADDWQPSLPNPLPSRMFTESEVCRSLFRLQQVAQRCGLIRAEDAALPPSWALFYVLRSLASRRCMVDLIIPVTLSTKPCMSIEQGRSGPRLPLPWIRMRCGQEP
jgi:hypothetical protein